MKTSNDPTISDGMKPAFEQERSALLAEALLLAPFDGWSWGMLQSAAQAAQIERTMLSAAFPRGVSDVLQYWSEILDHEMHMAMEGNDVAEMKIRVKVAFGIGSRLEAMADHKEAARRAAATLALPHMAGLGAQLVWKTSDSLWRALGDKSTDINFYSKRTILSGVWTSTFARWLADDSEEGEATKIFLAARIENVMQIETMKAKIRNLDFDPTKAISWMARVRYRS